MFKVVWNLSGWLNSLVITEEEDGKSLELETSMLQS